MSDEAVCRTAPATPGLSNTTIRNGTRGVENKNTTINSFGKSVEQGNGNKLNLAVILGSVGGGLGVLCILFILGLIVCIKMKRKREEKDQELSEIGRDLNSIYGLYHRY